MAVNMADDTGLASNDGLCSFCQHLEIEKLLRGEHVLLHENFEALRECGSSCYFCSKGYNGVRNAKPMSESSRLWRTEDSQRTFCVSVEYARWLGFPSLLLSVRHRGAKNSPIGAKASRENIWLYVKTVEGDPSVERGLDWVRILPTTTSSPATLDVAKAWVQNCTSRKCIGVESQSETAISRSSFDKPTRLIELSQGSKDSLRLVSGDQLEDSPYVALSYTWGKITPVWQTTRANVEHRFHSFKADEMPKTIADAIKVTMHLGLQYLWVDSICIVQDDNADWAREAARMADVYMNAHVTVAASVSEGSTYGLFNTRSASRLDMVKHFKLERRLSNGQNSVLYLSHDYAGGLWDKDVSRANLSTRAWCCQERLLSPRVIHFGINQIYWECRHCFRSEDNFDCGNSRRRVDSLFSTLDLKQALMSSTSAQQSVSSITSTKYLNTWYSHIIADDYSHRNLTYGKDKLIALSGLARAFNSVRPWRYYAGLWEENILCGLCWRRGIGAAGKGAEYRAPSWSWASQESRIMYPIEFKEPAKTYADVKTIFVTPPSHDLFGAVSDGRIVLSAPSVKGAVGRVTEIPPDNDDVVDLAGGYPGREVILENGLVVQAVMDDEASHNQDILVCVLLQTGWANSSIVFMLVLESVEGQANKYRRIGLVRQAYQPSGKQSDARSLQLLEEAEVKQVEIV